MKEYHATHKDEDRERGRQWRKDNPEKERAKRQRNSQKRNATRRERYRTNPHDREKRLESSRQAYRRNPERSKWRFHAYYIAHRSYYRMKDLERRIREKELPGTFTCDQIREQLKRQRYRCYYAACGHAKFKRDPSKPYGYIFHVDHVVPVSRVEASPRNDMGNIVLACPSCNWTKNARLPHEWPEGGRLL